MSLRGDERAQTVQVGAILLLGTLVVALSVYQVTSVPQQNGAVEFDHNQEVQSQLQTVRNAVLETAATDEGRSASVSLGTQYSNRVFAVNPSPPSGTLETVDLGDLTIENAVPAEEGGTATETQDFWDGSEKRYSSTALTYEPNYNEYREAPTTVYEHTALASQFGGAGGADRTDLLLSNQTLIDGRDITLVTLDGSFSETSSNTVPIEARPISVSDTVVPIESAGGPITLTLPTTLSRSLWKALLEGSEFVSFAGYSSGTQHSEVTIRLEGDKTYRLRMAKIGVGSGTSSTSAAYLTSIRGSSTDVPEGASQSLVVEARDRYNNPIGGEQIEVSLAADSGGLRAEDDDELTDTVTIETNDAGRADVTYVAEDINGEPKPIDIKASRVNESSGSPSDSAAGAVSFDLTVTNTDLSLDGLELDVEDEPGISCSTPIDCTYDSSQDDDGRFSVSVSAAPPVRGVGIDLASNDTGVLRYEPYDGRTNANGTVRATVIASNPGTVELTARGGGQEDTVTITNVNQDPTAAFESPPSDPTAGTQATFDAGGSTDPEGTSLTYEWDFGDGSPSRTTSLPRTSYVFETAGTYDVTLRVSDEGNATDTETQTVTVDPRSRVRWVDPTSSPGAGVEACGESSCPPLSLRTTTEPAVENEWVEYVSTNPAVATVSSRASRTGADGNATVGLTIASPGTTGLLTSSEENHDSIGVTTLLDSGFESGLAPDWRETGGGQVGVTDSVSNTGESAAYHRGPTSGGIESRPFDTSSAGLLVVEYWAQEGLGSSGPDSNGEDLIVEYRAADGTWVETDRIEPAGDTGREYNRRIRVNADVARHDDFALRFLKAEATGSDPWFVDDVRLAAVGGTATRGSFDNRKPMAVFKIDPPEPRAGDEIEFDASGSSDPDGDDLDYRWELTYPSGRTETAQGETPTTDPLLPDEYRMTLTVTDGDATDPTNQTFTVSPGLPDLGGENSAAIADAVEAVRDVDGDSVTGYSGGQRTALASDAPSWFE